MKHNIYVGVKEEFLNETVKQKCESECDKLKRYEYRINGLTYAPHICGMMNYLKTNNDFTAQLEYMNKEIEKTRRGCAACFSKLLGTSGKCCISGYLIRQNHIILCL